jgi:hypothetical protein
MMPQPRRVFFADVETPLSLTEYGYATLSDHDLALQQHTDQGMVFRVQAETAEQAAEQVIGLIGEDAVIGSLYDAEQVLGTGEPIAWVAGQLDPDCSDRCSDPTRRPACPRRCRQATRPPTRKMVAAGTRAGTRAGPMARAAAGADRDSRRVAAGPCRAP